MNETRDTSQDKVNYDEMIGVVDVNSYLKDDKIYSLLNSEDRIKACIEIYNRYKEDNAKETSVVEYMKNNVDFVFKTLCKIAGKLILESENTEQDFMDSNWDTIDEITNYLDIDSILKNNKIYSSLSYHPKSAAVLAIYNCYCKSFVDDDIVTDYLIDDYIRDNKEKVEIILKCIQVMYN